MLLIEIGGTHTRCAISGGDAAPERVRRFDNADYDDLEAVLEEYLRGLTGARPASAALAVAAFVDQQPLRLTNLGWSISSEVLRQRFGWKDVALVNDFEALACAIPLLAPRELVAVHQASAGQGAAIGVLGPGTGLGVSGLIPCGGQWVPISGEGGHVTLPAANDEESEILNAMRREHGHVSAEKVLSGAGLLGLYRLLAGNSDMGGPMDVTRLDAEGDDTARRALDLSFRFLGTVSAALALTLGARGGIYLGGGILPAIQERLLTSGFEKRFTDKGRFGDYLKRIPVYLIVADTPALRGISSHPRVLSIRG